MLGEQYFYQVSHDAHGDFENEHDPAGGFDTHNDSIYSRGDDNGA
jgi:hypothetical protein